MLLGSFLRSGEAAVGLGLGEMQALVLVVGFSETGLTVLCVLSPDKTCEKIPPWTHIF